MNEGREHIFVCLAGTDRSVGCAVTARAKGINATYLPGGKRAIAENSTQFLRRELDGKMVWLITDEQMYEESETREAERVLDQLGIEHERITFVDLLTKIVRGAFTG